MSGIFFFSKWTRLAVLTVVVATATARAADVAFYVVAKDEGFDQSGTAAPTPKGNPYRFNAFVGLTAPNSVTNATVQSLPGGQVYPLAPEPDDFDFQAKFTSLNALNAAAPNGNYQMVIKALHDGTHTITLPLTGDAYPSTDPHISNYAAAQAINPAAAFALNWDPFSGGTTNDFIQVTIANALGNITFFQSPNPGQPGALSGTATSLVIPANRLPSSATLLGRLLIAKTVTTDSTSYPGVLGFASYYKFTDFGMATTTAPAQDVSTYTILKEQNFNQTGSGPPASDPAAAFRFIAVVGQKPGGSISNVNVQLPGGQVDPLSLSKAWSFARSFSTQNALDAAFVPGVCTLTLTGVHDGFRSLPQTLPPDAFPLAPHINNFTAAQAINPATDFDLRWDGFAAGAPSDDILIDVFDPVGGYSTSAILTNTVTNYHFPANSFQAAHTYQATLTF